MTPAPPNLSDHWRPLLRVVGSFFCNNGTVFDQRTLSCRVTAAALPCQRAGEFYASVDFFSQYNYFDRLRHDQQRREEQEQVRRQQHQQHQHQRLDTLEDLERLEAQLAWPDLPRLSSSEAFIRSIMGEQQIVRMSWPVLSRCAQLGTILSPLWLRMLSIFVGHKWWKCHPFDFQMRSLESASHSYLPLTFYFDFELVTIGSVLMWLKSINKLCDPMGVVCTATTGVME